MWRRRGCPTSPISAVRRIFWITSHTTTPYRPCKDIHTVQHRPDQTSRFRAGIHHFQWSRDHQQGHSNFHFLYRLWRDHMQPCPFHAPDNTANAKFPPNPVSSSVLPQVFTPGEIHPPLQIVVRYEKYIARRRRSHLIKTPARPPSHPWAGLIRDPVRLIRCRGYVPKMSMRMRAETIVLAFNTVKTIV